VVNVTPVMASKERTAKIVLLGDANVGKSSIVTRFITEQFDTEIKNTVGAAFVTKTVETDGESVKFQIWDTAGQERFRSLAKMYYQGTKAAICVFDTTVQESFEGAKNWIRELREKSSSNVVIVLCGNKVDLSEKRQVRNEQARMYAQSCGLLYTETSAKTGMNVHEMFGIIANKLPEAEKALLLRRKKLYEVQLQILDLRTSLQKFEEDAGLRRRLEAHEKERSQLGMVHEVKDLSREELNDGLDVIIQELNAAGESFKASQTVKITSNTNLQQTGAKRPCC